VKNRLILILIFLILPFGFALDLSAADLDREKRLEAEIVDSIIDGEPVKIDGEGHEFLAIYTETDADKPRASKPDGSARPANSSPDNAKNAALDGAAGASARTAAADDDALGKEPDKPWWQHSGDDPLQVQWQKIAPRLLQAHESHCGADIRVGEPIKIPQRSPRIDIRNRLNIKGKTMH